MVLMNPIPGWKSTNQQPFSYILIFIIYNIPSIVDGEWYWYCSLKLAGVLNSSVKNTRLFLQME